MLSIDLLGTEPQWYLHLKYTMIFIAENAFANVVCKMVAIFSDLNVLPIPVQGL